MERRVKKISEKVAAVLLLFGMVWCLLASCATELNVQAQEESEEVLQAETERLKMETVQKKRQEIKNSYFGPAAYTLAAGISEEMYLEDHGEIYYCGYSTNHFQMDGNISYCLEPSQETPANGYYTVTEIDGNSNLGKAMYYTVGAPGEAYVTQYWGSDGFWQIPDSSVHGVAPWEERYAYCHMFLSWIYSGYDWDAAFYGTTIPSMDGYETLKADFQERLNCVVNVFPEVPSRFRAYIADTGGGTQVMSAWHYIPSGFLQLKKESANIEMTEENPCYSLENAQYGVYADSSCTEKAGMLTTNAQGESEVLEIDAGTYYVKEETAPYGYALDEEIHTIVVESRQTAVLELEDIPQNHPVTVLLNKVDAETKQNIPQGIGTLEHAEFTVKYYPVQLETDPAEQGLQAARTWVLETDETGTVMLEEAYKVAGDEFYTHSSGKPTFPLGTVTIQETKASKGYLLNPEVFVKQLLPEGTGETVELYQTATVPEISQKGQIELQKRDKETGKNVPQGSRTLQGAVYDVFLKSAYRSGDDIESESYCESLVTDENGMAKSKELPLDTYYVIERQASEGYLLDPEVHEVSFTAENETDRVFTKVVVSEELKKEEPILVKTGDVFSYWKVMILISVSFLSCFIVLKCLS